MVDHTTGTGCPLLVFADDWGRHPSSCQHLVRHLLDRHPVHWINTIGMRKPSINWATFRRAGEKARQWCTSRLEGVGGPLESFSSTETPCSGIPERGTSVGARAGRAERALTMAVPGCDNPRVHNPHMWPWLNSSLARWLNRQLLRRQLGKLLRSLPEVPVAVTTIPVVADLVGELPVRHWVYYCVDDFGVWPGVDGRTMHQMEEKLIHKADIFLAVSDTLRAKLAGAGKLAHLLTHGVDLPFWREPGNVNLPLLEGLARPLVVFWGVIDRRMDVEFIRQLSDDLEQGTILLVGPEADPDPALFSLPRIVRTGALPLEQLPPLAREAAVLVMPYQDAPVTRAMQPLKLKEYLATGRPTVVRDLPANRSWADCLDLVSDPVDFSQMVRNRLQTGLPETQARARSRLEQESWAAKAAVFAKCVLEI